MCGAGTRRRILARMEVLGDAGGVREKSWGGVVVEDEE